MPVFQGMSRRLFLLAAAAMSTPPLRGPTRLDSGEYVTLKRWEQQRQYVITAYGLTAPYQYGVGKRLNWHQLADIVDWFAKNTPDDETFRKDLWHHFGDRGYQSLQHQLASKTPPSLRPFVDRRNIGLNPAFFNLDEWNETIFYPDRRNFTRLTPEDQFHHYLGAVTGNTGNEPYQMGIPSHKLLIYSTIPKTKFSLAGWWREWEEAEKYQGRWNEGDVKLFEAAIPHTRAFLEGNASNTGRFTVAANIRKLLIPLDEVEKVNARYHKLIIDWQEQTKEQWTIAARQEWSRQVTRAK